MILASQELRVVSDCICAPHATGPSPYINMDPETEQNKEEDCSTDGASRERLEASMGPRLESEKPVRVS